MEPIDKKFIDTVSAKVYSATRNDRQQQTEELKTKLDELKPTGEVKVTELPDSLLAQAADWTAAAQFVKALSSALSLKGDVGEPGEQGTSGERGEQGLPGKDGKDGKDGADGRDGVGKDGTNGKDGKDGSPDTADQIVEKLSTLKNAWLGVTSIKGFEEYMREFGSNFLNEAKGFAPRALASLYDVDVNRIANGQALIWDTTKRKFVPGATTGGGLTQLTATGTVDGVNAAFTFVSKPTYIVSDGAWYVENSGWTWSGLTATLSVPPQTGIFGFS